MAKIVRSVVSLFDTGVRPAIDAWLLAESKKVRSYGDYWSASQAGYCQRKVIFERLGVPHVESEDDARRQRVFTAGHLFHAWAQNITKEAGISIASEVELQDEELMVRGHFDDLVLIHSIEPETLVAEPTQPLNPTHIKELSSKQYLILYDYKTRNSRNFNFSKSPSYFHRLQLGTYMYMLRKRGLNLGAWGGEAPKFVSGHEMQEQLTEARVLNIEKDTLRMSEVQYLWSPQLESDVLAYWNSLNAHWKAKTLPKCTCADHENGFMAREKFNPYFRNGEPCSLELYQEWKATQ